MLEVAIIAFTTFFATIEPVSNAVIFAVMTPQSSQREKRRMALRGCLLAAAILASFALSGKVILGALGISIAALKVSAGILLLLIAIDMVFARASGISSTTPEENQEANAKNDISVFPLATPLIAGPGAIGAVILLIADNHDNWQSQLAVVLALAAVLLITYVLLLMAGEVQKLLGVTGMHVISRVFGVLLSALAVQFMIDGLALSGLIGNS